MTELERRALLGDKQAQDECTRRGIVLPCPICGKNQKIDFRIEKVYHEKSDCIFSTKFIELDDWNTRAAPPIGRCGECEYKPLCINYDCMKDNTGFCKWFKPKED